MNHDAEDKINDLRDDCDHDNPPKTIGELHERYFFALFGLVLYLVIEVICKL